MFLYHGSMYKTNVLKPAFAHTNILVRWDKTEDNKHIYATPNKEEATDMGFASLMEKLFPVHSFHSDYSRTTGKRIKIQLESHYPVPKPEQYQKQVFYLYTIDYRREDGWVEVKNKDNNMENEYKTIMTIDKAIVKVEDIVVKDYLSSVKFIFE